MYVKASLLLCICVIAAMLLFLQHPSLTTVILISLIVWSSARVYYFCFYVMDRYIDPEARFSGLISMIVHKRNARSRTT